MATSLTQSRYPHSTNPRSVEQGLEFQDFCQHQLLLRRGIVVQQWVSAYAQLNLGESESSHEFKLDKLCNTTGRLSIEIAEKSRADLVHWTNSGIFRVPTPLFYVQGDKTVFWMFHTQVLIDLYRGKVRRRGKGMWEEDETLTVRKFYLPLQAANDNCILRLKINEAGQYDLFQRGSP